MLSLWCFQNQMKAIVYKFNKCAHLNVSAKIPQLSQDSRILGRYFYICDLKIHSHSYLPMST